MKKPLFILLAVLALTVTVWGYIGRNNNLTADVTVGNAANLWQWPSGMRGVFEAAGDFGGGTLTLYRWVGNGAPSGGDGEWVAFSGAAFSDDGGTEFVTAMEYVSIALSGSTSPDINYYIAPIAF